MVLLGWMPLEKSDLRNTNSQGMFVFSSPQHILSFVHFIALYDKAEVGPKEDFPTAKPLRDRRCRNVTSLYETVIEFLAPSLLKVSSLSSPFS